MSDDPHRDALAEARHVEWVIVYTDVDLNVVCEKP